MSIETTSRSEARSVFQSQKTHVVIAGTTGTAIDIAILLRRMEQAVTVVGQTIATEDRKRLDRSGAMYVAGLPAEPSSLRAANLDRARSIVVAVPGDLAAIHVATSARLVAPGIPVVCHFSDAELAARVERTLGFRGAICAMNVEAVHLAASAVHDDVVGAFRLDGDLVSLHRSVADTTLSVEELESQTGHRLLSIETMEGASIVAPSPHMRIVAGSILTTLSRTIAQAARRSGRIRDSIRFVRANTPRTLQVAMLMIVVMVTLSIFVFKVGLNVGLTDATYLVLNTVTTVGYGDITPSGAGTFMLLFGSFVSLLGPALLGTILLIFSRLLLRSTKTPPPDSGHVVIVAERSIAERAARHLRELSIDAEISPPHVEGVDDVDGRLESANVRHARALVAATDDPVLNVTLGLGARELNPSIRISVSGPQFVEGAMGMTTPASGIATSIALAASGALVDGQRYALSIGDHIFSFFEGCASEEWNGQNLSDVAGSYNFLTLFRRRPNEGWKSVRGEEPFVRDDEVLVVTWKRLRWLEGHDGHGTGKTTH